MTNTNPIRGATTAFVVTSLLLLLAHALLG